MLKYSVDQMEIENALKKKVWADEYYRLSGSSYTSKLQSKTYPLQEVHFSRNNFGTTSITDFHFINCMAIVSIGNRSYYSFVKFSIA